MKISAWESTGPGKFDNRAAARVYAMSLDGGCETLTYDNDGSSETLVTGRILGLATAGAIVFELSSGAVDVEYFDDAAKLAKAWQRLEKLNALYYAECDVSHGDNGEDYYTVETHGATRR